MDEAGERIDCVRIDEKDASDGGTHAHCQSVGGCPHAWMCLIGGGLRRAGTPPSITRPDPAAGARSLP